MDIDAVISKIIEESHRAVNSYNDAFSLGNKSMVMHVFRAFLKKEIYKLIDEEANCVLDSLTEYEHTWNKAQQGSLTKPYDAYSNVSIGTNVIRFLIELVRKPIIERRLARLKEVEIKSE